MRILVATDQWFPDLRGGSARVATETARGLARRGHDVTVIAPAAENQPVEAREGSLTLLRVLSRRALPQTFADPLGTWRQARRFVDSPIDLVVAHQVTTAAGLLGARLGVPLVLVYHASVRRELLFLRGRHPVRWKRLATYPLVPVVAAYERIALRAAARVLILSEFTRSLLRADHGEATAERALRVPGGVDTESFSPGKGVAAARARLKVEPAAKLLLTVRRLEPRMGLEELIRAMSLPGVPDDATLTIVGRGSLERQLDALARDLGLGPRVRFIGRASDEELSDWYRSADLFVLPTVAYEGFGMATAEALSSGTPVVGTPVGATPELLAPLNDGLIAADSTPPAIAEAIGRGLALSTPAFREACRDYAVASFAWERILTTWEEALASVLSAEMGRSVPSLDHGGP